MFGSEKFERKYDGKKIKEKSGRKEKIKKNFKINLKSINYFYIILQIYFTYFSLLYRD